MERLACCRVRFSVTTAHCALHVKTAGPHRRIHACGPQAHLSCLRPKNMVEGEAPALLQLPSDKDAACFAVCSHACTSSSLDLSLHERPHPASMEHGKLSARCAKLHVRAASQCLFTSAPRARSRCCPAETLLRRPPLRLWIPSWPRFGFRLGLRGPAMPGRGPLTTLVSRRGRRG